MLREKRQAAVKCQEKLHASLKPSKNVKKMPKSQSNEEKNKTRPCSVLLTEAEIIPLTKFNERNIKPCYIKLTKANEIPVGKIIKYSRNCVYESLSTNGQLSNRQPTTAVKTSKPEGKIYDFLPSSQSSQSGGSDDESMKNIIQKLQTKGNVRIVKGRKKVRATKNCLNKSWTEKNIRKAKKLIKPPKMNKIDKLQIIEVLKNDIVIPIKKHQNINKSILPSIGNNISKDKPPEMSKLDKLQNLENRNNVAIPVKDPQNNINKSILPLIDNKMANDKPPGISKLDKVQSIEFKNNVAIPTKKQQHNINESILPLIDNISEDNDHFGNDDLNHFGNDDTDYSNNDNQMNNSNIENINPNLSTPKTNIVNFKPMVRSPLKPLNTQIISRPKPPLSKKDTPTLRNNLLKRLSLCKASINSSRTDNPKRICTDESQTKIEDANVTNYFGFTSDLASEPSMKNASANTSTPVRPMTKDTLISKLLKLRSTVLESKKKKIPPRAATRPKRKSTRKRRPIEVSENSTINFENALSSTLLEATLTKNKNVPRTYTRHQNKNQESNEKTAIEIDLFDNTVEVISSSSDDLRSPVKKGHAKVYEKKKVHVAKKVEEDPQLQSFYESFNNECQEVDKFKLIIQ